MSDYFSRVERQLAVRVAASHGRRRLAFPLPHPWPGAVAAVVSCAVVVAVIVALGGLGHGAVRSGPAVSSGSGVTLLAITPGGRPATSAQLNAAVATLRQRLRAALPGARLSVSGSDVTVRGISAAQRALVLGLAGPGALQLFDWERSVMVSGHESLLAAVTRHERLALTISQGVGPAQPGSAGAGAMTIAQAAVVAQTAGRSEPQRGAARDDRPTTFYLRAPGTDPACATPASADGVASSAAHHACLLAGPSSSRAALRSMVTPGVSPSSGHVVAVPPGYAIVQANGVSDPFAAPFAATDPRARFFVVRGPVDLTTADLVHVHVARDQSGQPDVQFGFTALGATRFQAATAGVAHRGQEVSQAGEALNQHFAVVIDGRLITVPQIDFRTYPDGIAGSFGADITGGFTPASARALASVLATGPLAVTFVPR